MRVVAGVDFGTLSVRVFIVDSERRAIGSGRGEYPLHRKRTLRHAHGDIVRDLGSGTGAAQHLRDGPQVDVEYGARRLAFGGIPKLRRSA